MATFQNQATLTYNGNSVNSNIITGELLEVLNVTKTAVRDTYTAGDRLSYVVTFVNSGAVPLNGLTLTDDLGAYPFGGGNVSPLSYVDGTLRYYINGVLQPDPAVTDPFSVTGISVPAGGNATVVYETAVNGFAPPAVAGTIRNTVTVTGGGLTAPVTADATVTAVAEPVLDISKSLSPTEITENGQLTYTFLIQNRGNTEAATTDNVSVTDTFNPILSDLVVTYDGTPLVENTDYTYNAATGLFQTVPGRITVPAATFLQDPTTGGYVTSPGTGVLAVTGTV